MARIVGGGVIRRGIKPVSALAVEAAAHWLGDNGFLPWWDGERKDIIGGGGFGCPEPVFEGGFESLDGIESVDLSVVTDAVYAASTEEVGLSRADFMTLLEDKIVNRGHHDAPQ